MAKSSQPPLLGILVGGASSRMHGFPKGLLSSPRPSEGTPTLVESLAREFVAAAPGASVVLVGKQPAYQPLGIRMIDDDPEGIGPLGGLRALLLLGRIHGSSVVLASCDLPHVTQRVFERLLEPDDDVAAVAVLRDGRFEPFPSRHDPSRVLPFVEGAIARREHSIARLLSKCEAHALSLEPDLLGALDDWDRPEDVG
jgi:molybdopterin-guanine dinucleotide biosynthesis protein A